MDCIRASGLIFLLSTGGSVKFERPLARSADLVVDLSHAIQSVSYRINFQVRTVEMIGTAQNENYLSV